MTTAMLTEALASLTRHRGVFGALVADADHGLVVEATVQHGVSADAIAALAASLYRKAQLSSRAAGLGDVSLLRLEAGGGQLCAIGCGEVVLVVVAEARTNVGLLRAEMHRAAERLA